MPRLDGTLKRKQRKYRPSYVGPSVDVNLLCETTAMQSGKMYIHHLFRYGQLRWSIIRTHTSSSCVPPVLLQTSKVRKLLCIRSSSAVVNNTGNTYSNCIHKSGYCNSFSTEVNIICISTTGKRTNKIRHTLKKTHKLNSVNFPFYAAITSTNSTRNVPA